ncbi:MAG: hypothetical protein WED05_02640 [Candidatus Atabeyarchaeum deiterrae]
MVSSQDIAGALASLGTSFITIVPLGIYFVVFGLTGFISVFMYDWILLALCIGGIVFGAIIAGLAGQNSAKAGASAGAVTGLAIAGGYFMYGILTGGISMAIFNSMDGLIFSMIVIVLAVVMAIYSCAVYLIGQYARQ